MAEFPDAEFPEPVLHSPPHRHRDRDRLSPPPWLLLRPRPLEGVKPLDGVKPPEEESSAQDPFLRLFVHP
jgi:hypothetical protein